MNSNSGFWDRRSKAAFRDALNLRPLTEEEAGQKLAKTTKGILPDVVVDAIVNRANEISRKGSMPSVPAWTEPLEVSEVEQDLVAMHRNEDCMSSEVEEKLRKAREALEQEEGDDGESSE